VRQKIFVIVASGGEYDSAWESNVVAYSTPEAADAEVNRLTAQRDRLRQLMPAISDVYFGALKNQPVLERASPAPTCPKKATREQQQRYSAACAAWREENLPLFKRNEARQQEHFQSAIRLSREKAIELGCDELDLEALGLNAGYLNFDMDADYNIEELELR
jgi:hypothetical protein